MAFIRNSVSWVWNEMHFHHIYQRHGMQIAPILCTLSHLQPQQQQRQRCRREQQEHWGWDYKTLEAECKRPICTMYNVVDRMPFVKCCSTVAVAAAASLTCSLEWKWIVFNDYTFPSSVHVQYERLSNNNFFLSLSLEPYAMHQWMNYYTRWHLLRVGGGWRMVIKDGSITLQIVDILRSDIIFAL